VTIGYPMYQFPPDLISPRGRAGVPSPGGNLHKNEPPEHCHPLWREYLRCFLTRPQMNIGGFRSRRILPPDLDKRKTPPSFALFKLRTFSNFPVFFEKSSLPGDLRTVFIGGFSASLSKNDFQLQLWKRTGPWRRKVSWRTQGLPMDKESEQAGRTWGKPYCPDSWKWRLEYRFRMKLSAIGSRES